VVAFVLAAVSLWLLRAPLAAVYGDLDDVHGIDWRWLIAIVGCEVAAFVASWELNRLSLRTDRWFDVAVAQLSGNAASNVVPAGGPAGAAVQLRVLSEAGFDLTRSATALGALSLLGVAGLLALPVLALPFALATGSSSGRLEAALWAGFAMLLIVAGVAATFLTRDAPLTRLAAGVQWLGNRLRRGRVHSDLPARVLSERDAIRAAFNTRPGLVGLAVVARPALDCAALYLSLLAVGVRPAPLVVVVAFGAANVAGMIPVTPGGLGFVEAGLTATLVASGIGPAQAALAAALYRLASTWLPVLAGVGSYGLFRYRRRGTADGSVGEDETQWRGIATDQNVGADGTAPSLEEPVDSVSVWPPRNRSARGWPWRRIGMTAVTVAALVLVFPVLSRVYRHAGEAFTLGPVWLVSIGAVIVAHFLSVWALYRIILRTSNRFDIATSQLAANATSHVAPAGSAVGAGIQLRMLTIAGFSVSRAATALAAAAVVGTVAGYIVLPLMVLLASTAGGGVPTRLVTAMWSATAVLTLLLIVGVLLATRDQPWRWAARVVAWMRRRFHRPADAREIGDRLIDERNLILSALRERLGFVVFLAVLQPLTDYAALLLALRAVGAHVSAAAAMAAFVVSNIAGLVPFTPGGLGFVEAGLAHILTTAGASRPEAHLAIATYRLAATWLPCLAGFVALVLFQRRHRLRRPATPGADKPLPGRQPSKSQVPANESSSRPDHTALDPAVSRDDGRETVGAGAPGAKSPAH
jgi:uncharacterized protein (TIRG00374 family)